MPICTELSRALTTAEIEALSQYGADSTFLHVVAQGRSAELSRDPMFAEFSKTCGAFATSLDSAIAASILTQDATLYSAHGNGFGIRGSLRGIPERFVGMIYAYPGYISTTSATDFRDRFLEKRRDDLSQPTILELHLPSGFNVIDMNHGSHRGEFEFLIGRNKNFDIVAATLIHGDVLSLTLRPGAPTQSAR